MEVTQAGNTEEKSEGELSFEDNVLQTIIGVALKNVDGLISVDGGFFSDMTKKLTRQDSVTSGIEVEVGKKQVAVDLDVVVAYGKDLPAMFSAVQEMLKKEVARMTSLEVVAVNLHVKDILKKEQLEELEAKKQVEAK